MNTKLYNVSLKVEYDPDSGIFYNRSSGRKIGFVHNPMSFNRTLYIKIQIGAERVYAHRLAWYIVNGDIPDGFVIDHIDKNGLNNSISNLRLVTYSENNRNADARSKNKTGIKGVAERKGKFVANIKDNGVKIHIGTFETLNDAHIARKQYEKKLGW